MPLTRETRAIRAGTGVAQPIAYLVDGKTQTRVDVKYSVRGRRAYLVMAPYNRQ